METMRPAGNDDDPASGGAVAERPLRTTRGPHLIDPEDRRRKSTSDTCSFIASSKSISSSSIRLRNYRISPNAC
jgi:hypothetical protein